MLHYAPLVVLAAIIVATWSLTCVVSIRRDRRAES